MKTWCEWFLSIIILLLSAFVAICPLIICACFNAPVWLGILLYFWGLTLIVTIFLISYITVKGHEFGHNMQQLIFGPFQIFIWIASASRYWYRKIKNITNPPYDSIWFERTATNWGYKSIDLIEGDIIK